MRRLLIGVLAAALTAVPSNAQQFPVGFVDVQKVFDGYKKASEAQERLKADLDQAAAAMKREKEKIVALKDGLDLYVAGTKEHLDQLKKIRMAELEVELTQQVVTLDLQVKLAETLKKIYADVQKEVKALAEEKGLKLVLMYQASELKARNRDDAMNNILIRPVLYYDPAADLTGDLLARLNK
jgi:Skp family chaperone for outer membrane proteins